MNRVRTGQRLDIPAGDWNAAMDAAADLRTRQMAFRAGSDPAWLQSGVVRVRNDSGADRSAFDVLGVSGVIVEPADNLAEFQRRGRVCLTGVVPAKADHVGKFVVLIEPLADGAIGKAVAAGVVQCQVDVQSEGDQYAEVADGSYTLASGDGGTARILSVQSGTGVKWAVVRIGNATAGESGGSGDSASGVLIDSTHKLYHTWAGAEPCWVEGPQPTDGNGDPIPGEWRTDVRGRVFNAILAISAEYLDYYSQAHHNVEESGWTRLGYDYDPTVEFLGDEDPTIVSATILGGSGDNIEVRMDLATGFLYYVQPNDNFDPPYVYAHLLVLATARSTSPEFECNDCDELDQADISASGYSGSDPSYNGTHGFKRGPNWGVDTTWEWENAGQTLQFTITDDGPYTVSASYHPIEGGSFQATGVDPADLRCLDGAWTGTVELAGLDALAGQTLTIVFGGS